MDKQVHDIEASQKASEAEAFGRVVESISWNPYELPVAVSALDQHVAPLKDLVVNLSGSGNPIFNVSERRHHKRFKISEAHTATLDRMARANEQT